MAGKPCCIGGAGAALHKAATIPAARSAPTHGITIATIAPEDKPPLLDFFLIGVILVVLPIDVLLTVVEVLARTLLSINLFNSDSLYR